MITTSHPLVKLLEQADQLYVENPLVPSRGRPYTYSQSTMFKCLVVKTVKRLELVS